MSENHWLASRFDAVTLAKAHRTELTPQQVDLVVGPRLEDRTLDRTLTEMGHPPHRRCKFRTIFAPQQPMSEESGE